MKNFRYLLAALVASGLASAQELDFKSTEVVDGLYMIEGVNGFTGGNLGLSIGEDGVVLIDDAMGGQLDAKLAAAIDAITSDPVDFVVNTHVHGDHIGGNVALAGEGATIVAHNNIRHRLVEHGMMTGQGRVDAPEAALPVLTFNDEVTFHLNDKEAHVFHVAKAHTDGDAVIHFRNMNVIHTGDLFFNGLYPFIDLDSGGTVHGYIAGQKEILSLADEETKIIPGHGPMASKSDLQASVDMLEASTSRVQALIDAGKAEDEVVAENPLADFDADWTWGFINTERLTRTIYKSLTAD